VCASAAEISLATSWQHYAKLAYVSCQVDVLAVQLNLLVALSQPHNQVGTPVTKVSRLGVRRTLAV
jgi:hypothetical protein